jgi:type I restriction enzyme, R subunit
MTYQSEQSLENELVKQLVALGYEKVVLHTEAEVLTNLKLQIEKHNAITLTEKDFTKVLNHLSKGNVFDKAKTLRDRMQLTKEDGRSVYIEFMNQDKWCQNRYQVTTQVTIEGEYTNRYDVTLLINGLPIVQIELKRRGLELKEAFNQIKRYGKHSFGHSYGLFQYIQMFVISNGVNTKYFANVQRESFKQTFHWTNKENQPLNRLYDFTEEFLEPCHMSKMVARYIVLSEAGQIPLVLRPYQYYAVEAIIDRVKNSTKNGYIWHTTGSGKTLTSFKASQILSNIPEVTKVVFVVDRKDLDYQTTKEFNSFSKGSVDGTDNTNSLVEQFGNSTKLIVTTIQKLNTAISKKHHAKTMDVLKNEKIVFIFDECHRSQFGDTHKRITQYFTNCQLFGFTGTPIFAENAAKNAYGKRTTKELFTECLHKYVITDAIKDENVLKFSIEYVGGYKEKLGSKNYIDIEVEDIDRAELLQSHERLDKISDYIIAHHDRKTHSREFTAIFCVSSVETLIKYYDLFKFKKNKGLHNLKIATIFSYGINEDDNEADGIIDDIDLDITHAKVNSLSREKLDEYIIDYNKMFGTKYSTKDSQSFYDYYKDVAKKVKERKVDILLVVNMFLTGFDSKSLNTLYVDKNLQYHGLIQAFSRTNRILNERKSQGNIVCFRNLKQATDDAIALFSDKNANEVIFKEPYDDYIKQCNEVIALLKELVPTPDSVHLLADEEQKAHYVKLFREIMRLKNTLVTFADFSFADLNVQEQEFEDYKSTYLDIYESTHVQKEKVSILEDIDFELELIHKDEVNVSYILKLLTKLHGTQEPEFSKQRKQIVDSLSNAIELRSKRELINEFIEQNLPNITDSSDIEQKFTEYWTNKKVHALKELASNEGIAENDMKEIISNYLFSERKPLADDLIRVMEKKPKIRERRSVYERIISKVMKFIETFEDNV